MERSLVAELKQKLGAQVRVEGWVHAIRLLGKVNFMIIRDRSGLLQIVITDKEQAALLKELQVGSVVDITGTAQENKQAKGGVELVEPELKVVSKVTEAMPIEINKDTLNASIDTILDYRPLTLRHKSSQAIFRIQATLVAAYREFLTSQGFTEFFGPTVIGASSEGGSEMFKVQYFDHEALLSQSAQLYKQMMVGVYERVFALMKCYRAEKSNTRRHLTEATQFEFEMGFIESYTDVMDMLEQTIKFMVKSVQEKCQNELQTLGLHLALAPEAVKFPRVTFKDALEIVYKQTGVDERDQNDLSPLAEKTMCEYARKEFGTDFIFVTNFLRSKTAFYAHPNQDNPEVTDYFDLLCREIEIVSGGQRINDYDQLVESLKLKGLNPENFTDYLSIFKFGMPPHGGFGMGMERLTMMLLGLDNIRYCTLFPSDPRRIAAVKIAAKIYFGSDLAEEISKRLIEADITYKIVEHEATPTSEKSAEVRQMRLSQGVKAIILRGKKSGKNVMVCIPADLRVDMAKVGELEGEKFEFEKPETIKERFGLEVGGIPPFGNLLGMTTYYSPAVLKENEIGFNDGALTSSLLMKSADLVRIVAPIMLPE